MKRRTVIIPFNFPGLTDTAAALVIEVLHELIANIEHHYAEQAHQYRKHQQEIQCRRKSPASRLTDPPF